MTHTPGPWVSGVTKKQTLMVYGPQNQTIAEVRPKTANALANTYLIAAAPDLLAILDKILRAHESDNNGAVMGEAVLCRQFELAARAAIDKATK